MNTKTIGVIVVIAIMAIGSYFLVSNVIAPSNSNLPVDIPTTPANGSLPADNTTTLPGEPPEDMTWISPGKVMVGNFYPGAEAEWTLLVHNGDSTTTDTKLVTTEAGEYSTLIPLNKPLYDSYIDIYISSDNPQDNVEVIGYNNNTQEILVAGFQEDRASERILSTTYKSFATFSVTYRYPDHVGEDYVKPAGEVQDWIIIADATPVLAPRETKEILVILAMPSDAAVFAPKWEFWISVIDTTQTGMVQTELCSRWLVTMRG